MWVQLRPGTDGAVLLGMIHYIIEHDLYDHAFVERWCHGFDALRARATEYPLERVEEIIGAPAGVLSDAEVAYAVNRPGAVIEGMGVEQSPNAAQILRARACLSAICVNYDVEGGNELPGPPKRFETNREMELVELLSRDQRLKQVGHDRFRLHSMPGQELLTDIISSHYGKRGGMHWYTGEAHQPSVYRAILSDLGAPRRAERDAGARMRRVGVRAFARTNSLLPGDARAARFRPGPQRIPRVSGVRSLTRQG